MLEASAYPEIHRHLVRLRFTHPARFSHFLHGGVVHGLLGRALRTRELPASLVPSTAESGHNRYEPGDRYHLGLTFVGTAGPALLPLLLGALGAIGRDDRRRETVPLGGNFEIEEVVTLPPVDIAAEATALPENVALRFVSPLRLKAPVADGARDEPSYLSASCFPADHFLDRLWRRLFHLAHGRWPSPNDLVARPALSPTAGATTDELVWVDLPHPKRRRTLGGVMGSLTLDGVPPSWRPTLALGRHLHAGAASHFGFGRYVLSTDLGPLEQPARALESPQDALDAFLVDRHAAVPPSRSSVADLAGVLVPTTA